MSLLRKLFTAVRGGVNDAGEAIVDSQEMRILDQEIRDSKNAVAKAEQELTKIMADHAINSKEVKVLEDSYNDYLSKVKVLKEKNETALALEVAEKMVEIDADLKEKKDIEAQGQKNIEALRNALKMNKKAIEKSERQVQTLKANNSLNKATESIMTGTDNTTSDLANMTATMEKLKKKTEHKTEQLRSAQLLQDESSGEALDRKLESVGLSNKKSAEDLLKSI